ncbi:hypothetical protein BO71DRAFT_437177 [Aspergillus ellipticus CBS 707.79]|uniref:AA1-like domain-containing protein n=1 Tax=Aspergillus ellipticus CBS 707.79 TaxID=1448320 RepID=A0A319EG94_9EURO|nr:hypothetical protein BO71DRAFT_437177 [Aspergillus ellipticus CBS 707.79]
MKSILANTLLTAMAMSSAAAVLPRTTALSFIQIYDISAQVDTTANTGSMWLDLVDTNEHDAITACNVTWTPTTGLSAGTAVDCLAGQYALAFPDGLSTDITDFTFTVESTSANAIQEAGDVTLDAGASGSSWVCGGVEEGVGQTKCEYDGYIDVDVSST